MATSVDCTMSAPQDEARPFCYLPFPLLPASERLVVDRLPGEGGTLYRSGNIMLRAVGGEIASVHIHRVRLVPSDTQDLWRVLSAAAREGLGALPGERPHAFIVPPPARRISAGPILDDGAPNPEERQQIIGVRYGCGQHASLIVRLGGARRGWLNAFGVVGLDAAAVLRDLPAAVALLREF
ncbi:MAG: hypothetical protein OHK0022_55780 [Roseiflexaceae bacterium]